MKITKKQAEKRAEKQVLTGLVLKKFETDEEFKNKLLFAVNVFFPACYLADDALQDIDLLTYKTFLSGGIRKQVKELATICDRLKKELTKDPTIGNEMQQDADLIDDTYSIKQLLLAVGEMTESQFQSLLQYAHKIKEK